MLTLALCVLCAPGRAQAQPDDDRVQQQVHRVFERREFHAPSSHTSRLGALVALMGDWLGRSLDDEEPAVATQAGGGGGATTPRTRWAMLVVLSAVAAVLWLTRTTLWPQRRGPVDGQTQSSTAVASEEQARPPQAAARVPDGDLSHAIRGVQRMALQTLQLQRRIGEPRALTTGQLLQQLKGCPEIGSARARARLDSDATPELADPDELAARLAEITQTFERCWYGQLPVTAADCDRCEDHLRHIVALGPRP